MNQEIVTIYQFKLTDEIKANDFLSISGKADTFLKSCSGFRYRSLTRLDDKQWLDIIYWANPESAEKANKAFDKNEDCKQFMSLINTVSVKMQTAELASEIYTIA